MPVADQIWVEKYRPQSLNDIVGHDVIVERMEEFLEDETMPNLLFAGPQGTGKTAITQAYARDFYGDGWRQNVMQLNASDDRGIDVVRDKIKTFARQGSADADYKIIFLDEADQLTKDAQPALRRVMEDYSDVTRFILSCNYLNQIIQPLQSRCAVFRVKRLDKDGIHEVLNNVIEAEDLDVDDRAIDMLIDAVRGDARKAVNALQAATVGGRISEEGIESVVGVVDDSLIQEITEEAIAGDIDDAMRRLDIEVLKEGVDPQTLSDSFLRVLKRVDMPADARVKCIDKLAETEARVNEGANPNVQFHSLLAHVHVSRHLALDAYKEAAGME